MCEWKTIEGFEDYEISSDGQVYSHKSNKILSPNKSKKGYLQVSLYNNGKERKKLIHRLVAEAFITNPDNLPEVNHIDENKHNNNISNLEWCTRLYNMNYGTRNKKASEALSKPIAAYTKSGELVAEYPSLTAAAEAMRVTSVAICNCLTGRAKTSAGYIWKYLEKSQI